MKHVQKSALLLMPFLLATQIGCDLETEEGSGKDLRPAPTLVINEVFALPVTHPTSFCWVEFINPTQNPIEITDWTLTASTYRQTSSIIIDIIDDTLFLFREQTVVVDGFGPYAMPISQEYRFDAPDSPGVYEDTVLVPAGGLYTITNNEQRLLMHSRYGPGDEALAREIPVFEGQLAGIDTVQSTDSTVTIRVRSYNYVFTLAPTDQLILRNAAGEVVDVVRYGNFVYSGGPDPYPGNQTLGMIPEFESISRFAVGFYTGNTVFDFYQTRANMGPSPHGYNQGYRIKN